MKNLDPCPGCEEIGIPHDDQCKAAATGESKRRCGCVYSLLGYALYLCPEHDENEEHNDK